MPSRGRRPPWPQPRSCSCPAWSCHNSGRRGSGRPCCWCLPNLAGQAAHRQRGRRAYFTIADRSLTPGASPFVNSTPAASRAARIASKRSASICRHFGLITTPPTSKPSITWMPTPASPASFARDQLSADRAHLHWSGVKAYSFASYTAITQFSRIDLVRPR